MIWGLKKYIIKIYSGVFFLLNFSTEMLIGMMNGTLTHNGLAKKRSHLITLQNWHYTLLAMLFSLCYVPLILGL